MRTEACADARPNRGNDWKPEASTVNRNFANRQKSFCQLTEIRETTRIKLDGDPEARQDPLPLTTQFSDSLSIHFSFADLR